MTHAPAIFILLFFAAGIARAAETDVRGALDQMGNIERQMDELRRAQWEERNQLVHVKGSLDSIEKRLNERNSLRSEGQQFLKDYQTQAARQVATIDRNMDADMASMRAARRGLATAGVAMQRAANDRSLSDADRLALALLWRDRHQVAEVSAQRLLRMESRRAQLLEGRDEAGQVARQHSVFTSLSEQELSEKHKQLAEQVASLQSNIGRSEEELKTLASRREELRSLMAKLVEAESKTVAAATPAAQTPTPAASPTPTAEQQLAAAMQPTEVAPVAENQSAPLVTRETESTGDGTRQLFWRAEPIGVCALGSGRVVFAEPFAGYRNLLIIDHGNGWRTLYGNLTSCSVELGAQIAVGDVIGQYRSGEGSHAEPFWFEVRQGVAAVRPDQWSALPTEWEHNLFVKLNQ